MSSKKKFKLSALCFAALYLLLFIGRVIYQINVPEQRSYMYENVTDIDYDSLYSGTVKNIATLRSSYTLQETGTTQIVDQKYEKIATVSAVTADYDIEEGKTYDVIENNKAIIQQENKSGLEGTRRLNLIIGVKPENFEDTVAQISKIGKIVSTSVTKIDKTNEYKQMIADREKLEKTKESYISLREHGGSISERLTLEQSIIDIEGQILNQSVNLGEYSDENSFCTVNFTLAEGNRITQDKSILTILLTAFEWSIMVYAMIIALFALTSIGSLVVLMLAVIGKKCITRLFAERK